MLMIVNILSEQLLSILSWLKCLEFTPESTSLLGEGGAPSSHPPGRILHSGKKYGFFNAPGHSMPLTGFVTLGKLLNLSELSFCICKIGMMIVHTTLDHHDDYII